MFKSGHFYLCLKEQHKLTNEFIKTVFGKKYNYSIGDNYIDNYDSRIGFFIKNKIYFCPKDYFLKDEERNLISFSENETHSSFEEVKIDYSFSDNFIKLNGHTLYRIMPHSKIYDCILYKCEVQVVSSKNNNYGYGIALSSDPYGCLNFAYKRARKELLQKTKLYKSLYGGV